MEAFTFLKYWKSPGGPRSVDTPPPASAADAAVEDGGVDDGPFFDLEFAVPAELDDVEEKAEETPVETENEGDHEMFYNGLDSAPLSEMEEIINAAVAEDSNSGLVKAATKLRVFMLGLKRSKSEGKHILPNDSKNSKNCDDDTKTVESSNSSSCKFMTVRLKIEDVMKVPKLSLLTRASNNNNNNNNSNSNNNNDDDDDDDNEEENKKRNSNNNNKYKKEVVRRYMKLVRPLYVKVGKRANNNNNNNNNNNETSVGSGEEEEGEEEEEEVVVETAVKGGKPRLNLKVLLAKKHLGKSKSAVVHSMPSSSSGSSSGGSSKTMSFLKKEKSDDSMLQHEDCIQSAILHCKRSFNSSSSSSSSSEDGEETTSILKRSASEPAPEKTFSKKVDEE